MKIAVIGLGFMGATHIKALRSVAGAELAAVVSSDEKKLAGEVAPRAGNLGGEAEKFDFSGVRKYRTAAEAIADPEIDAVNVCLPTHLHAPVALEALRGGKHVLVEKPMALNAPQCEELIAEAKARGKVLMAGQVLRFVPQYQALSERVKSGALGPVRSALFRRCCAAPSWGGWFADADQSGGGVFDLLIHDVDFAVHLFGMPDAVRASGHEALAGGIDWIAANLEYAGGPAVLVTGGWHPSPAFPFSMEFTVAADGGALDYHLASKPLTFYRAGGAAEPLELPETDWFASEISYFVNCAAKGEAPVLCPPEESAAAVSVMQAMRESRKRNGERVTCR